MNMALNDKPNIFDYFSAEWVKVMPFFTQVFARYRFLQIHWMLHAAPITPESQSNQSSPKAEKVQNVINIIHEQCLKNFLPACEIAIDETTIAFKGRVGCKMYNP